MGVMMQLGTGKGNGKKRAPRKSRGKPNYRKQGATFEADTVRSLKDQGYIHRLYDTQDWQAKCEKRGHVDRTIMAKKQPGDFLFIAQGLTFVIECKSSRNPLYVPFQNFKDHQMEAYLPIETAGCNSAFHFHFIGYTPYRKTPTAYLIRTDELHTQYHLAQRQLQKGLYWNIIRKFGVKTERLTGQKYDLYPTLMQMVSLCINK